MKDCLSSIHPALIFQNIDKPIKSDSYTVGFKYLVSRLRNFKIPISYEDEITLKDLQKRRNQIEHHRFEDNETNELVIGKALRFLYYFLPSHFDKSLEELLTEKVYCKVWELILGYEERLAEAKKAIINNYNHYVLEAIANFHTLEADQLLLEMLDEISLSYISSIFRERNPVAVSDLVDSVKDREDINHKCLELLLDRLETMRSQRKH